MVLRIKVVKHGFTKLQIYTIFNLTLKILYSNNQTLQNIKF